MTLKIKKHLSILFALILLFTMVIPPEGAQALFNEEVNEKNFQIVAENDLATLEYNRREALFRVTSKATGVSFDTKAVDGKQGNAHTRNLQRSDLIFEYFADTDTGHTVIMDNYSMAISLQQYESEEIDNGLKIRYNLGKEELSLQDLPKYVSSEKMYEKVISHLSTKQRETLENHYTLTGGRYVRRADSGVAQLQIKRLHEYFFEVGEYTPEDLIADNEEFGVEETPQELRITAAINYTLDGLDLIAEFSLDEFESSTDIDLARVTMLPYLMSSAAGKDGYLLVPDGSGAIQYFDSGKRTATNYRARVYGNDILKNPNDYVSARSQLTLPMVAINYGDHAILGLVETAQDMATLSTEISGRSDEYNKASFDFLLNEIEQVKSFGTSSVTLPRTSTDTYEGSIRIRYRLIDQPREDRDEVDLVQIAGAYREYLQSQDQFPTIRDEQPEHAPIFLEFLGAMRKEQIQFGLPIPQQVALTTTEQVSEILKSLEAESFGPIHAVMSGYFNGGILHNSLKKLRFEKVTGSLESYQALVDDHPFATFYSSFNLGSVQERKGFKATDELSRALSGEYARIPISDALLYDSAIDPTLSPWLISPTYYDTYFDLLNQALDSINLKNIGIFDLGNTIVADYSRSRDTNRWRAQDMVVEALGQLVGEREEVLLSNPNDYAWGFGDVFIDLPLGSNGFKAFDEDVPFVQMVLGDKVLFAGTPSNSDALMTPKAHTLKLIEYGAAPYFQVTAAGIDIFRNTDVEGLSITNYDLIESTVFETYRSVDEAYQALAGRELVAYEQPDEMSRVLRYEDGTELYINYSNTSRSVNGTKMQPLSYLITEGGQDES